MQAEIIIMLTHHDVTVGNSLEVFEDCMDLPVKNWGFKDVGLPLEQMKKLVEAMKKQGRRTFLEVVTYTEEECMQGARLAVELGFDCLCGTLFYPAVWEYLEDKPIQYFPFVGKVSGSPSVLEGTASEMISQSVKFSELGIHGTDILAYRYTGDPEVLAKEYAAGSPIPVCMAGSIDSEERLKAVNNVNPAYFTMGSALFDKKFISGGTFRENLEFVLECMDMIK